jgi:DNA-binding MarR family transcriptional regulator
VTSREPVLRARTPLRSPAQAAAIALLRAADWLRRELAGVVEPHGITLQQFNVLRILRGARAPLPTLEIASRMVEQAPGITRLLDRLEAKGLVARQRCESDRRQVLCSITRAGRDQLAALDEPFLAAEERLIAPLSRTDMEAVARAAARLVPSLPTSRLQAHEGLYAETDKRREEKKTC